MISWRNTAIEYRVEKSGRGKGRENRLELIKPGIEGGGTFGTAGAGLCQARSLREVHDDVPAADSWPGPEL